MRTSKSNTEPCGIRLMKLIDTRLSAIAKGERHNDNKMCLYGTGEYWVAFDHSAYQLKRLFPDLKIFVVNHPLYPFTVVGASIPDVQLNTYRRKNMCHKSGADYLEYAVDAIDTANYSDWHSNEVRSFGELGVRN